MAKINTLPDTLVSQIKAGEVVDRPASALKELIENSIDSGATSIKVSIEQGGLSLIKIEDNGQGIEPEDLPLAFTRHATSKILTFEDLQTTLTMGFRGEALASIASVSRCTLTSKTVDGLAHEISVEEGRMSPVVQCSRTQGTTISVQDLFFYVPARRKFLKSEATESNHCRDAFIRSALSRPDIAMTFIKDNKLVYKLPVQSLEDRAQTLLGHIFSEQKVPVNFDYGDYHIEGFACPVQALPSGRETQLLYVNHRYTRDKLLNHAVKEALHQSRGHGREKDVAFVLYLNLPTHQVDANAHPAKTEVRFKDSRAIHQFVYQALLSALNQLDSLFETESTAALTSSSEANHLSQDPDHSPFYIPEADDPSSSSSSSSPINYSNARAEEPLINSSSFYSPSSGSTEPRSHTLKDRFQDDCSSPDQVSLSLYDLSEGSKLDFSTPSLPSFLPDASSFNPFQVPVAFQKITTEVANEAERFLGVLRQGYACWDAQTELWMVPITNLSVLPFALHLKTEAEEGRLVGVQQLIPPQVTLHEHHASILKNRNNQLLALGLTLEWSDAYQCSITFAPEHFDNCQWTRSLIALAEQFLAGHTDALSLCLALTHGCIAPAPSHEELWQIAHLWMSQCRLSREIPGSISFSVPSLSS